MIPVSTSELKPLEFDIKAGEDAKKFRMSSDKIGWLRAQSDKPGFSFDITIKDALGRTRFSRQNCKNPTTEYGELVNHPALLGEELEVVVGNVKGAEKLRLFLN